MMLLVNGLNNMELRFYPINNNNLYALNLKLHVTELLALHYDSKKAFEDQLLELIKEATLNVAEELKDQKLAND